MDKGSFAYRCKIEVEILANREQEYIRRNHEEYESEFDDLDDQDAKRWIKDITISTYCPSEKEAMEWLRFQFHNGRLDAEAIIEDGYLYWFDNNCLVNNERLLHRARIYVEYACDMDISDKDLRKIAVKDTEETKHE